MLGMICVRITACESFAASCPVQKGCGCPIPVREWINFKRHCPVQLNFREHNGRFVNRPYIPNYEVTL